jgi:hypothetical protein
MKVAAKMLLSHLEAVVMAAVGSQSGRVSDGRLKMKHYVIRTLPFRFPPQNAFWVGTVAVRKRSQGGKSKLKSFPPLPALSDAIRDQKRVAIYKVYARNGSFHFAERFTLFFHAGS